MTTHPDPFASDDESRSPAEARVSAGFDAGVSGRTNSSFETAPNKIAFGPESPNLTALDAALVKLAAAEQLARQSEAARVAALAELDGVARLEAETELSRRSTKRAAEDSLSFRAARAEAAVMLHLSEQTVAFHLTRAATLTHSYQETFGSLASGEITIQHANAIVDAGHIIGSPGQDDTAEVARNRAEYEAQVLEFAVAVTPQQLRPIARRIAEIYALEDLDSRYDRAKHDRRVWITERENGLVELCALLPAHTGKAAFSRLTQMSKRWQSIDSQIAREANGLRDRLLAGSGTPAEAPVKAQADANAALLVPYSPLATDLPQRTLDEFRADLFSDLLLNGTGDTATGGIGTGIAGVVQIIAHADQIDHPTNAAIAENTRGSGEYVVHPLPEMEGYGPIPVAMAQDIAAHGGTWNKVTVNMATGTILSVENYRPSEAIRRFLTARDQHCRFPGCRVPVHRCDFDHTVDAALGGETSTTNLGALCRGHHMLKHHSGWGVKQQLNGDYDWTSPTGRTSTTTPISRVLFRPVESSESDRPIPKPKGRTPSKPRFEGIAPRSTGKDGAPHPF